MVNSFRPNTRDVLFLLVAALAMGFYLAWAEYRSQIGFSTDDAWIYQSYARTLAQEGQWAMVPGYPSSATTSPLYPILLAPGFWLGLGPFAWTFLLGWLLLSLTASLSARLAEECFPDFPWIGWAVGLTIVLTWQMLWVALAGLETPLATALLAACYLAALRTAQQAPFPTVKSAGWAGLGMGLLCGLLTQARPDTLLFVGWMGLGSLWVWGRSQPRHFLLWGAGMGAMVALFNVPFLAWTYHVSDSITPVTGQAKLAEYRYLLAAPLWERYWSLSLPLLLGIHAPLLMGLVLGGYHMLRRRAWLGLVPFLWAFSLLSFYAMRLPLATQNGRYVIPMLPLLTIFAVGGVGLLWRWGSVSPWRRILTRTYAFSLPLLLLGTAYLGAVELYSWEVEGYNNEIVASAQWVAENIPADELMVAHDVGALGYFAPRPIMDTAGLVSPELIPYITDFPALAQIACQRQARWMFAREYQRIFPYDDPRIEIVYTSPVTGETSRFVQASATNEEGPWAVIRVYRITCTVD